MDIFYEAKGNYKTETLEKTAKHWIPDGLRYFVYAAVIFFLLFSLFFFMFRGYIVSITFFVGAILITIEYWVSRKWIVKKFIKGMKELNAASTEYHLYFYGDKVSATKEPEVNGISLEYSCLRKVIEIRDLFILVTDANLCIPIEKNSLNPSDKYGWLDLLCADNKKLKLVGIK